MKLKNLILLTAYCLLLTAFAFAQPKEYDGLWFMGFNMHKDIFSDASGLLVRKAFFTAINRSRIAKDIMGDDFVPTGMIPKGMLGFDPALKGYPYNPKEAKRLMRQAGYPTNDKRLKILTLLHTDGKKTIEIAKWIKRDLIALGVDLTLKEVKYEDQDRWQTELESGAYHMFLMGKKELVLEEGAVPDTAALLKSLFHSQGDANFTFYRNSKIDTLLDELEMLDKTLISVREEKLKEINRLLLADPPVVNLFYIIRL